MLGIALLFSSGTNAQSINATIQVIATVQQNPTPMITLNWSAQIAVTSFTIYRKAPDALGWTTIATLSGTTFTYTDTDVVVGTRYEYRIQTPNNKANGYITSGINIPATTNRGIILLIVDDSFRSSLATALTTYIKDLEGEGWFVKTSYVSRTAAVPAVKAVIQAAYNLSPGTTKAVVLIGHVPVPYSGDQAPDGHPDHLGAWPADVYYADMDGIWTDTSINDTTASDSRNWNIPGDGKFDQVNIPSSGYANNYNHNVELEIGRIDLSNLPSFTKTELQLLQDYFTRNHNYRTKQITYVTRALIDDNFGAYAESAWWLTPLVGAFNTATTLDYKTTLNANSYLWSYGNGAGSYTSLYGIGTTADFAVTPIYTVFTMLFGSYTGDWDTRDNFMRASLAAGAQTVVWAGRPNWFFHDMGVDTTIGYSNRKVQNNLGLYQNSGYGAGGVYVELLGDPTLRNQVISPPSNLTVGLNADNYAVLNWTASTETGIAGYNIYRRRWTATTTSAPETSYTKVNASPVTTTSYTADCGGNFNKIFRYVVRAVKLVTTPSGSYYLESTGAQQDLVDWLDPKISFTVSGYNLITSNDTVSTLETYGYDYNWIWFYTDGTYVTGVNPPTKTFSSPGTYSVSYWAAGGCRYTDTVTKSFTFPQ